MSHKDLHQSHHHTADAHPTHTGDQLVTYGTAVGLVYRQGNGGFGGKETTGPQARVKIPQAIFLGQASRSTVLCDTTNPSDPGPAWVLSTSPRSALGARVSHLAARLSPGPAGRGPGLPSGAALCGRAYPVTPGDSRVPTQRPQGGPRSGAHCRDAEAGLLSRQGLCPRPSLATAAPATFPAPCPPCPVPRAPRCLLGADRERRGPVSPCLAALGRGAHHPMAHGRTGLARVPRPWVSKQVANEQNTVSRSNEVRTLLRPFCRGRGAHVP